MTRIVRVVYVAYFIEVGLALIIVPWSDLWARNYFAQTWPWVERLVSDPYLKGAVSGLGLVNLALGLSELAGLFRRHQPVGASDAGLQDVNLPTDGE